LATGEFKHESLEDVKSIGEYLRALIEGLETGHLELSDDNGQMTLHPSGLLGLEVRAKRRGNLSRLHLEVSWTEDNGTAPAGSLRVRSDPNG